MVKNLSLSPKRKVSLIFISALFLAACIQQDETLAPKDHQHVLTDGVVSAQSEGVASMTKRIFTAHLNSSNEVANPAVVSQGQGQAIFSISKDGSEIQYQLNVANIENVTMSHIHCGAKGVNGPIVVFLFGRANPPVTVNGTLAEGTITAANILPNVTCAGGTATYDLLIEMIRSGGAYVNVHTTAYPPGEIRGQIH